MAEISRERTEALYCPDGRRFSSLLEDRFGELHSIDAVRDSIASLLRADQAVHRDQCRDVRDSSDSLLRADFPLALAGLARPALGFYARPVLPNSAAGR